MNKARYASVCFMSECKCDKCLFIAQNTPKEYYCEECGDGEISNQDDCQECCPHDELDHFICLACSKEFDPGDFARDPDDF